MGDMQANLQELLDSWPDDAENKELRTTQRDIIGLWTSALNSIGEYVELDSLADETADSIRKLDPKDSGYENGEALQIDFWWILLRHVAPRVPYLHAGQRFLVKVVKNVHAYSGDDQLLPWNDLEFLGMNLQEAWIPPFLEDDDDRTYTLDQWLNLNSFAARLQAVELGPGLGFALWELRSHLEEKNEPGLDLDTGLSTSSEWMLHCGKAILQECLKGKEYAEYAEQFGPGSLFKGPSCYSLKRWNFWKRRFGELKSSVSEAPAERIDDAVYAMIGCEEALSDDEKKVLAKSVKR